MNTPETRRPPHRHTGSDGSLPRRWARRAHHRHDDRSPGLAGDRPHARPGHRTDDRTDDRLDYRLNYRLHYHPPLQRLPRLLHRLWGWL